jgi:hypothetical protein
MKQSPNQAKMETSLQAVLKEFYTNTIVPRAEAEQLDPVELFNATIKGALGLKEQDTIDERRSSFFTLKS